MNTERPRKVFISSTFQDLKDYRSAVLDAIQQVGLEPIFAEAADIQFQPGEDIQSSIKNELERSNVIILIIGHRYGAVLPESGKSWTEAEYEYARKLNKPILAYIASEDVPWPPSHIDIDRSKIFEFKKTIARDQLYKKFSSPSDLAASLVADLTRFLARREPKLTEEIEVKNYIDKLRIIRLLLSSPGDVADERDHVAKAVFRFNQESVQERRLFIKLIRWEDMAPQIGPGPQNTINAQIGIYNLFVGIMWNRFGTPTEIAASGAEEEFRLALDSWSNTGKPWITFYFCERPANFTTKEQLEQKSKVLDFKAELSTLGVLRNYKLPDEFEDLVYRDLIGITSLPEFLKMLET